MITPVQKSHTKAPSVSLTSLLLLSLNRGTLAEKRLVDEMDGQIKRSSFLSRDQFYSRF